MGSIPSGQRKGHFYHGSDLRICRQAPANDSDPRESAQKEVSSCADLQGHRPPAGNSRRGLHVNFLIFAGAIHESPLLGVVFELTRNKLTDYWKGHEKTKEDEYAFLTNIIHQEWSGISVKQLYISM